tara:strand:- start:1115 stop:1870 length:756 start_codon:yes stop_codon:yes gene_type:complete
MSILNNKTETTKCEEEYDKLKNFKFTENISNLVENNEIQKPKKEKQEKKDKKGETKGKKNKKEIVEKEILDKEFLKKETLTKETLVKDIPNNCLSESNNRDLLYLANKEVYNRYKLEKENIKENILHDFTKYKLEIREKINEQFAFYSDPTNDLNDMLESNNEIIQQNNYFYLFIKSVIKYIKTEKYNALIQNNLTKYTNRNVEKGLEESVDKIVDINQINKEVKATDLSKFVTIKNAVIQKKILPKKIEF